MKHISTEFHIFIGNYNGMLRHSLATLEGEHEFLDFSRALLPLEENSVHITGDFYPTYVHIYSLITNTQYSLINFQNAQKMTSQPSVSAGQSD